MPKRYVLGMRQIFKARGTGICLALSFDYSLYSVSSSVIIVFFIIVNEIVVNFFYFHRERLLIKSTLYLT